MEALWFLAISRNGRPEKSSIDFQDVSVAAVCDELRAQINTDVLDPRKFFYSTQLVYGTLQLYKIQIEKLYDQSRNIVQSWNSTKFNVNWLQEMSQREPSQVKKPKAKSAAESAKKAETKKITKKPRKSAEKNAPVIPESIVDDLELLEEIFKIPIDDGDGEMTENAFSTSTGKKATKKGAKKVQLPEIDQNCARHVKDITMLEPSHIAATSGYQTLLTFDDDDFGEASGNAFKNLLKDNETNIAMCGLAHGGETSLLRSMDRSHLDSAIDDSCQMALTSFCHTQRHAKGILQPRRLTYSSDRARNIKDQQLQDELHLINMYDMPTQKELATFDENANVMETSGMSSVPFTIENQILSSTLHNDIAPEIPQISLPEITQGEIPPIDEPELVLERLDRSETKRKYARRSRKLVIDKETAVNDSVIIKNFETYKAKLTQHSPFESFDTDMSYLKHCADALFAATSDRMKNSNPALTRIYMRNMVKIPEKILKRRISEQEEEKARDNKENGPTAPKRARSTRKRTTVFKEISSQQIEDLTIGETEIPAKPQALSPPPLPRVQEMDMQAMFEMEVDLPPYVPNESLAVAAAAFSIENHDTPPEKKRRENRGKQQLNKSSASSLKETESEGSEYDQRAILLKLKELWSRKATGPTTMSQLCADRDRFEAAKIFFELLILSKIGVLELAQQDGSLEITDIRCTASKQQLAKLCK